MKLLIAEDDHSSRIILKKVALKWGYEAIAVDKLQRLLAILSDNAKGTSVRILFPIQE